MYFINSNRDVTENGEALFNYNKQLIFLLSVNMCHSNILKTVFVLFNKFDKIKAIRQLLDEGIALQITASHC